MKHLTILVPEGENNLSSITGSYELFNKANAYWKERNNKEMFTIQLVGNSKKVAFNGGLFTVNADLTFSEIDKTDLIIIPSLNHNYELALRENKVLQNWLVKQYKEGAEVASICTGAFILASAGL